jgi:bifunctional DNase/RNase
MKRLRAFLIACGLGGCMSVFPLFAAQDAADPGMVVIEQVEAGLTPFGPVVLLRARNRAIPIFVDPTVAESIQGALSGGKPPRPLSHDLMHSILHAFEGRVSRAVITLKGSTYYADLTVMVRDATRVFDSRSSDAIALAIHFRAPILVSEALLESAGQPLDAPVQDKSLIRSGLRPALCA